MVKLNAIDLFAGAGGLSTGMIQSGINVKWANELNSDACLTYSQNHPNTILCENNIKKITGKYIKQTIGNIDLVAGGPPCQGFSLAGKRDPKDPRNKLFNEFHRIVSETKPSIFVMENVKGLLSFQNGKIINNIKRLFEKQGYHVGINLLNASNYGVPQNRERVFIIGSIDSKIKLEIKKQKQISVKDAIDDLAFLNSGEYSESYLKSPNTTYQKKLRAKELKNHKASKHSDIVIHRFSLIKPGHDIKSLPKIFQTSKNVQYKLCPNKPARTVTTLPEDYIHYSKNRILTVRELARLQSFPDSYEFLGPRTTGGNRRKMSCPQYTQVGNAVPPILSKAVFSEIQNQFS